MTEQWPLIELIEVCETIVDCVNKTAPLAEGATPYRMLRTTNVRDGYVDTANCRFVSRDVYEKWTRRQVPRQGDVILTREAPLGEVGMLRDDETVFLGQRLMSYRADPSKLDANFLLYSLMAPELQAQIRAAGSGATVEHMRVPDAERLKIRLPDLSTQQRIGTMLAAYDALILNNQRRIAVLEDIARRLFNEWFIQPIGKRLPIPGDRLDEWALPTGWRFSSLIATANVTMGQSPASSEYNEKNAGMPFHQGVTDFKGKFHTNRLFLRPEFIWKRTAEQGDILFSVRAPVGRIAIALDTLALGRGLCAIRDLSDGQAFLLTHLLMSFPKPDMFGGGTIYKAVTKDDIHSVPILIPPRELKDAFERHVSPMWDQLKALTLANTQLRKARDLLLPKLISGEIHVSVADETFPEAAE